MVKSANLLFFSAWPGVELGVGEVGRQKTLRKELARSGRVIYSPVPLTETGSQPTLSPRFAKS